MKALFLSSLLIFSAFSHATPTEIAVGAPAPQVAGTDETGKMVSLAQLYQKGKVLVYFYPKADTSGCTAQACSLRDSYQKLQDKGVTVVGVSTDSVADQMAFKKKHRLPFTLISDSNKDMAKAFSVPVTLGFASRQAFLIVDGKIAWLDRHASTDKQAADVLEVLAKLK
jgi:peroxiredoxin Q/BCP